MFEVSYAILADNPESEVYLENCLLTPKSSCESLDSLEVSSISGLDLLVSPVEPFLRRLRVGAGGVTGLSDSGIPESPPLCSNGTGK